MEKLQKWISMGLLCFILSSCKVYKPWGKNGNETQLPSVNNNVCKKLKDKVVIYAVFVDSKYTNYWTEYDMKSTLDSIEKAVCWIGKKADSNNINLKLVIDYHQDKKKIVPITANLTGKTLSTTLFRFNGIAAVDRWADKVGKEALKTYGPDTSQTTRTKINPKDRERLLARIRDIHETDNVVLLYFINNYYKEEISVSLHNSSYSDPEYSVVSFKNPSVIAHEILHNFGAIDLYMSPWDKKRKSKKKKNWAMKTFPDEIMAFAHRNIDSLNISPLTKYMIGWDNELDSEYEKILYGNKIKVAKY